MIRIISLGLILTLTAVFADGPAEEIELRTTDGITIYGDVYSVEAGKSAPVILLFHQGAANSRAEYATIVPRLNDKGFNVIAIDQRRGGDRLGGTNRTVDALQGDTEYSYCDAYPDLEAALAYAIAEGYSGKRIVWGSSYSATLAIQLAYRNSSNVDAVLAFSPAAGGPLQDCSPTPYIADMPVPLLALRPASEMELESSQNQFRAVQEAGQRTFVSANGVHGSSMLNPDRVDGDVEATWDAVISFIDSVLSN